MAKPVTWTEVEARQRGGRGLPWQRAVLRRKGLLVVGTLLGALVAGLYLYRLPPVYQARVQLLLVRSRASGQTVAAAPGRTLAGATAGLLRQLDDASWLSAVIEKHQLKRLPSLADADEPTPELRRRLSLVLLDDSGGASLVELRCRGPQPDDCRKILEALTQACLGLLQQRQQEVAGELKRLLEQCRNELTAQIARDEKALEDFRATAGDLSRTPDMIRLHQQRIGDCEQARTAVLKVSAELDPRIASIEAAVKQGGNKEALAMLAKNLAATDAGPAGPRAVFDQQLFVAQLEERQLLSELGNDHPRVKDARRKAQLLQEKLGIAPLVAKATSPDFVDVYLGWLRQERKLTEAKLKEIDARTAEERTHIARLEATRQKADDLQAAVTRSRRLFDATVERLMELTLADEEGRLGVRLVAPPENAQRLTPGWLSVLGLGAGLGLVVGTLLSGLVEFATRRYRFAGQLKSDFGATLLGTLPAEEASSGKAAMCVLAEPQGPSAAAHRRVLAAVEKQLASSRDRLLAVTSVEAGAGQTPWAANLAVLLAQAGRRVLLVDADFRHGRLHDDFALDNARGLSTLLSGAADVSAVIRETKVANLWAVTTGSPPDEPADVLVSPRLRSFLDAVRPQFDLVLLATGPLLESADATLVATRCDGLLLAACTAPRTRRRTLRGLEIVRDAGIPLLGIALLEQN